MVVNIRYLKKTFFLQRPLLLYLVEQLEKSSPLILEEMQRWQDLLWDDYLFYKHSKSSAKKPSSNTTFITILIVFAIGLVSGVWLMWRRKLRSSAGQ